MSSFNPHIAGNLKSLFDVSRNMPTGEALEKLRLNFFMGATMNESDDRSIGGLAINMSGRNDFVTSEQNKKKRRAHDMMVRMINNASIKAMENRLAEKYGEDFAENLAAEYLDKETYVRLMGIEDQTERRRQIAIELNSGIKNGTVDADKIYEVSDLKDWLGAHDAEEQKRVAAIQKDNTIDQQSNQVDGSLSNEHTVEKNHNLSDGNEESAFNAIFADKGPILK